AQPMLAKELNQTRVPEGYRPGMIDFLVPIGVLLGFSIVPWLLAGSPMIFEAFGLSVLAAMITSRIRGMSLDNIFDGVIDGIKGVTVGAIILGLAVTLGNVSESLGTSHYIIESTSGFLQQVPYILPGALMFICMFIAFSIGSSWGTYAVMYPIALPLAYALSPDPFYFTLNFGAILGGSVFGDQCSPISDTTILSAMACGADLMDHVLTQLPMALLAAGISAGLYVVISYVHFM
ncbi:MAG: sodium:proton antiporter, partial [Calditrichaeota bacterium]|nr:sodium:proton antiporter [Calditrichota bacterium]